MPKSYRYHPWFRPAVLVIIYLILAWPGLVPQAQAFPARERQSTTSPSTPATTTHSTTANHATHQQALRCTVCGRMLPTVETLKNHLVEEHHADPVPIHDSPGLYSRGTFLYRCMECSATFQSRTDFGYHFFAYPHSPVGPFQCPTCQGHRTEDVEEHRHHLMTNHVNPSGVLDIPRRSPSLPYINSRQLIDILAARSSGGINKQNVKSNPSPSPYSQKEWTEAGRAAAARRELSRRPCRPSETLVPEKWPSFHPHSFQRMSSCSPNSASTAPKLDNNGEPIVAPVADIAPSTSNAPEPPLEIRNYNRDGTPVSEQFALIASDTENINILPGVGVFQAGPSAGSNADRPVQDPRPDPLLPSQQRYLWPSGEVRPALAQEGRAYHPPGREEFCFIEADRHSHDFRQVVCVPMNTGTFSPANSDIFVSSEADTILLSSDEEAVRLSSDEDQPGSPREVLQPPPRATTPSSAIAVDEDAGRRVLQTPPATSTTWAPPVTDQPRSQPFQSSTPRPGAGPSGLPLGLLPLGGMLCVWSVSNANGAKHRRSLRGKSNVYDAKFVGEEVSYFWELFSARVSQALAVYQSSGRVPNLAWHCSVLRRPSDRPFRRPLSSRQRDNFPLQDALPKLGIEKVANSYRDTGGL